MNAQPKKSSKTPSMQPRKLEPEKSALLIPGKSDRRYKFLIANHRKLIGIMKSLEESQHRQSSWIVKQDNDSWCGSSACALGWAVMSGEFKGLGYIDGAEYPALEMGDDFLPVAQGFVSYQFDREFARAMTQMADSMEEGSRDAGIYRGLRNEGTWGAIGIAWFGHETLDNIFADGDISRRQVIEELEDAMRGLQLDMKNRTRNSRRIQ